MNAIRCPRLLPAMILLAALTILAGCTLAPPRGPDAGGRMEHYLVRNGIEIGFASPPSPWRVSHEPPDFLVEETVAHLNPAQLAAARKAGIDSPREAARQMLKGNELFIFNPQSGAHLEIDLSQLREGDGPPSTATLKASARFAAEGLQDEEGIEAARSKVGKTRIAGGKAYRVDADFLKHGKATRFVGVITFAIDHWVYLYYTGPQPGLEDLETLHRIFESFSLIPVASSPETPKFSRPMPAP